MEESIKDLKSIIEDKCKSLQGNIKIKEVINDLLKSCDDSTIKGIELSKALKEIKNMLEIKGENNE